MFNALATGFSINTLFLYNKDSILPLSFCIPNAGHAVVHLDTLDLLRVIGIFLHLRNLDIGCVSITKHLEVFWFQFCCYINKSNIVKCKFKQPQTTNPRTTSYMPIHSK